MDLSIEDFLEQIDNINQIDNELRSIENRMSLQRIAEALMNPNLTKEATKISGLDGLFALGSSRE